MNFTKTFLLLAGAVFAVAIVNEPVFAEHSFRNVGLIWSAVAATITFLVIGIIADLVAYFRAERQPGRDHHLLSRGPVYLGRTNEAGVLETEGLWEGPMYLAATHPDYALTTTDRVRTYDGCVIRLRMQHKCRLDARLLIDGHRPVGRWMIEATPQAKHDDPREKNPFHQHHRTLTASDGSFYFHELHAYTWRLTIRRATLPL